MPRAYKVKVVKASANQPCEILVHGPIGASLWSSDGISAKNFQSALDEIPIGQKVTVGINSQGGEVGEGLAIYNAISRRAGDVTCRIDGYALSIASVIPLASGQVVSPKSAIWMIHNAWSYAQGDKTDMRDAADMLETHDKVIMSAYTDKTGMTEEEIKKMMDDETWMTGQEASDMGFCDCCDSETDMEALDFSAAPKAGFKHVPNCKPIAMAMAKPISAPKQGADNLPKNQTIMNREKILALLKKHGITVPDNATDEQLLGLVENIPAASAATPASSAAAPTAPNADIVALRDELKAIRADRDREKKTRISAAVQTFVDECRIPSAQRDAWIARAMSDEAVLADLGSMPQQRPGGEPVATIESIGEDPRNIEKAILNTFGRKLEGDGTQFVEAARDRGVRRAQIIAANMKRIMPVLNTNTVSTDLKRTVILQEMIRAFAIKVLPLTAFSTRLDGTRLEGTDKVAVRYFALNQTASTSFVTANGYDTFANTNSDSKTVTLNKRQYQGLKWTSAEMARQPYMDTAMGALLLAEQLALDVVNDVLGIVTLANFGASVKSDPASAFDTDDVADLKGVADTANWPSSGRSLILNSAYDVNLLKDTAVKNAMAFGDNSPIREGRIMRLLGFDYFPDARIPSNGENLQGFLAFRSALLVAFAPINPTVEVRQQLTRYEIVTDPSTGATFEYRFWGDPTLDTSKEIIEVNYGKDLGETTALKRITSA